MVKMMPQPIDSRTITPAPRPLLKQHLNPTTLRRKRKKRKKMKNSLLKPLPLAQSQVKTLAAVSLQPSMLLATKLVGHPCEYTLHQEVLPVLHSEIDGWTNSPSNPDLTTE